MTLSIPFIAVFIELRANSQECICSLLCITKSLHAIINISAMSLHHACRHRQGCWEQPCSTLAVLRAVLWSHWVHIHHSGE